eukprot:4381211-Alexandrium_andersonii.AAC.1
MRALKKLVRFSKDTADAAQFLPNPKRCDGVTGVDLYTDSDWAGCQESRRSTGGVVVVVRG